MSQVAPGSSFTVDPAQLDVFASSVQELTDTMARHTEEFQALHLDRGVFGRLPMVSSQVHDKYTEHVEKGTEAFATANALLTNANNRAQDTAAAYREIETDHSLLAEIIGQELKQR
ncbi:hypothetical protein [Parenemella sanctibonifatiensis]|uniref:Uncharacterized protein n=1 Tax=Parenemella sanctibonifatiensis TaxID=2016505 RepID=A0A255ELU3_9ACTN|nr:hypothetical protein [Parenemella sanctibonifatiensis]OYN92518.1 hypothetical protein CGZ91_03270 [Parenemella sanctibonifatiensis]